MPSTGFAALSALALLGTTAFVALALVAATWGMTHRNRLLTRRGLQAAGGLVAGYLMVLGVFSLASRERVLAPGHEKYFCELDCHLAYSVERVESVRPAPSGDRTLWAVRLKTRFDQRTISATRDPQAPLWPNPRRLALIDASGRQYSPADRLELGLTRMGRSSTPLTQELRPGESYSTTLLFALPTGAVPSKLALEEDIFIDRFLIGHERSFFHAPVLMGLSVKG
jgi:hypothetical protein